MIFIIVIYIITILNFSFVRSSHFCGGTVTWKPVTNIASGLTIPVTFTQSYQWRLANTHCNDSYILNQSPLIPAGISYLQCVTYTASACDDYIPLPVAEYCTDFSTNLDSSSGQISTAENITIGSQFCIAFQSGSWVPLQTVCATSSSSSASNTTTISTSTLASCSNSAASWSIGCCLDLSIRSDGFINTPPVATILSPINALVNTLTQIKIPVLDADDDIVRCRWALANSTFNECGGVCGIASGSALNSDNCTLTFDSTGKTIGNYYPIALMIEDFYTASSTPLSSVPLQFLIKIVAKPTCSTKSIISANLSKCTGIEVGIPFSFTLTIEQGCTNTTIDDFYRMPPLYMHKSGITQVGWTNVWTVTETWTPTVEQIGSQVYCAVATDSANIQSDQYCTTFTVVPFGQASLCPAAITRTTMTTITTTTTTITSSTTTTDTTVSTTTTSTTGSSTTTSTTTSKTTTSITTLTTTTSTTTATTTSTTTATEARSVLVPVTVVDNSGSNSLGLGLGLGLGLLLLFLLACLVMYAYCCCKQCKSFSDNCFRRCFKRDQSVDRHMQTNKTFRDYVHDNKYIHNEISDYHRQYINNRHEYQTNNQLNIFNKERPLTNEQTFTSASLSDFELNFMNTTRTSLFSPSVYNLPNDDVQFTRNCISQNRNPTASDSILVRAYSIQEQRKSFHTSS